jgi:hypothetical protein
MAQHVPIWNLCALIVVHAVLLAAIMNVRLICFVQMRRIFVYTKLRSCGSALLECSGLNLELLLKKPIPLSYEILLLLL